MRIPGDPIKTASARPLLPSGASRFWLFWFAALLAALLPPLGACAQSSLSVTNTQSPAAEPLSTNRFLLVLDTSAIMRAHVADMVDVVEGIIRSSASGQLHNGDSIGVWTFNEAVYTGNMPLQTWSADDTEEITLRIAEFIRQQDYVKKGRLDLATSAINKVVKMSDILTVIIVSSGSSPISGTPFDDDLNAQYRQCLHDMGKKPRPIVTVLQGSRGKLIRYTVNAMPWPVVIPELPTPLVIASKPPTETPSVPSVPAAPTTAPPAANPVSTTPTPTPVPTLAPTVPNQPRLSTMLQGNTFPTNLPPPQFSQPAAVPPPQTVAAPPPVERGPTVPSQTPVATPPAPPVVAATTPPAILNTTPPGSPPTVPSMETSTMQAMHPMPATPAPTAQGPISPELPPIVAPHPTPLVPRPQPATEVMANNSAASSQTETPSVPAKSAPMIAPAPKTPVTQPASSPAPAPPQKTLIAQASALFKSYTGGHHSLLLIGGVGVLAVVLGLVLLLARRPHSSGRPSLITQTMDDRRR